ncbi:hypothetical protein GOP47_0026033 [Adiantum capillus-veneris]|uniref:Uncharacterized protein n=1 Tax=Adiantum capillus-veneris TaxID=13818 RepID=A0A9D4U3D8_ADICA|nr:hypothetical protein GOP47_0026033 [Adiantum capillus-veneris]
MAEVAEHGWSRVATHLEAAIKAIPRPNMEVIKDPKLMAKKLKALCKQLKSQLKDMMNQAHVMSFHVYSLMREFASKLSDLIARFFDYISHKVKSFLSWISGLIKSVKARFSHSD